MAFPIDLIIGDTTLEILQRLPSAAFTTNLRKVTNAQRAQSGTLHTTNLYAKYEIQISGIAQSLVPELRYEYEKDELIDLYMIVNRLERISPSGATTSFATGRRMRLDNDYIRPVVEYPIGTQIAAASITALTNSTSTGLITLSFTPTAGTNTMIIKYYPIISGIISEFSGDYDWTQDEESYNLTFLEA